MDEKQTTPPLFVYLKPGRDDDIIAWRAGLPEGQSIAAAARTLIREALAQRARYTIDGVPIGDYMRIEGTEPTVNQADVWWSTVDRNTKAYDDEA